MKNCNILDLLIIEDKESIQEYIKDRVRENYSYDIIKSFEEAKEKLAAQQYKIICLNLKILKKDSLSYAYGRDVLIFLRKEYSHIPVILITGYPVDEDNYPKIYPNIKKIIKKNSIEKIQDIISELYFSLSFQLLIIDDEGKWQEILLDLFGELCSYDMVNSDNALKSIKNHKYQIVCAYLPMTKNLLPYRKILNFLKIYNPELPLVFITDHYRDNDIRNLQLRFSNIKNILNSYDPDIMDKLDYTIMSIIAEKEEGKSLEKNDEFQKTKIFISYASEDYDIAKRLYDDLEREGATPWLDRENLLVGQNWKTNISQIIRDSSYFLLLISKNSLFKRGYVQKEQKIALEFLDEFPSNRIFIMPVRIDNTEPFDEKLKNLHWADISDYEKGLEQILKTLKSANFGD